MPGGPQAASPRSGQRIFFKTIHPMKMKFFWIPARDSSAAEAELNTFLCGNRVVQVEKSFCSDADGPGWALCVQWLPGDTAASEKPRGGDKVDYREVLDAPTFQIFAALRTWRKERAVADAVPIYTVASNGLQISDWLALERGLEVKAGLGKSRSTNGLPFLGYRITPQAVLLGKRARRRFTGRLRATEAAHERGEITTADLQRRTDALLAFTEAARCHGWRRGLLHPPEKSPEPQTPTVSCAAAPGTTRRRTAAPPSATGPTPRTGTGTLACVCPQLTRAAAAARLTRSLELHGPSMQENPPLGASRAASRHLPNAPGGSCLNDE